MDLIFPDDGLVFMAQQVVLSPGLDWCLYTNNQTPTLNDTLGNYTEAAWGGYASVTLVSTNFTITQVVAHVGSIQAGNIAFNNTSGSPVTTYGYFIRQTSGSKLIAAARFDGAPITIPNGGAFPVTPLIGDYSGLSS